MPAQLASSISASVGKSPAPNRRPDQEIVLDLLSRISPDDGGRQDLPPATQGPVADIRLVNAITQFQLTMAARGLFRQQSVDGRVDRGGTTLRLLNQFAGDRRGGGGLVIPNDKPAPPPPPPAAPKGPGFLQPLFAKLVPRPTNLQIASTGSMSVSVTEFGGAVGRLEVEDITVGPPFFKMTFAGAGLSLGPLPFGVEVAPSSFPSQSSRIHAGSITPGTRLAFEDLLGPCLLVGASLSVFVPVGTNATVILFGVGSSVPATVQRLLRSNPGESEVARLLQEAMSSFTGWGSTIGNFAGVSAGISMTGGLMVQNGGFIRPDPDVRRVRSFFSR